MMGKFLKKLKSFKIAALAIVVLIVVIIVLLVRSKYSVMSKLEALTVTGGKVTDGGLFCSPLDKVKRVYISAGMFDMADNIYSIGIGGLRPSSVSSPTNSDSFSATSFTEIVCFNENDEEKIEELKLYCKRFSVPWYGAAGEIAKMGWEAYIPVRDGFLMAPTIQVVKDMINDDINTTSNGEPPLQGSLFHNDTKKMWESKNSGKSYLDYMKMFLIHAIVVSIGANDLFAMYSSCNCCVFNMNGLAPDSGGMAEVGNLGARGVPLTILKSQITSDFAGSDNPMPLMTSSSLSNVYTVLVTTDNGSSKGALSHLSDKVKELNVTGQPIGKYGNSNNTTPLPPLQAFWSQLGSMSYYAKHKKKSIPTTTNGSVLYKKDYTEFWYKNVVQAKDTKKGFLSFAKSCGENLYSLQQDKMWASVIKAWA